LTAGVSVSRLLVPIYAIGFAGLALGLSLNLELVAGAARFREERLERVNNEGGLKSRLYAVVFVNRADNRFWYIRALDPNDLSRLKGVQIVQMDRGGEVRHKYYVRQAYHDRFEHSWKLDGACLVRFDAEGRVTSREMMSSVIVGGWSETPQGMVGSNVKPSIMGRGALNSYLRMNAESPPAQLAPYVTQLHLRSALPWNCLVVVCLAGPLGFIYSRRGMLGNVTAAILLFFAFLLTTHLFAALGEGARIAPWLAAWLPPWMFVLLGAALLHLRGTNRELPDLRMPRLRIEFGNRRIWAAR